MRHDAASAILLYSPGTRPTEAWMCCHLATKYSSLRIGPTEESVLTLPLLTHPCAALLSTYVWICAKGNILGAKSRIFMSSAPSSSLFIVTSHLRVEEDIRHAWVVREIGNTKQSIFPQGISITLLFLTPMHQQFQYRWGQKILTFGGS